MWRNCSNLCFTICNLEHKEYESTPFNGSILHLIIRYTCVSVFVVGVIILLVLHTNNDWSNKYWYWSNYILYSVDGLSSINISHVGTIERVPLWGVPLLFPNGNNHGLKFANRLLMIMMQCSNDKKNGVLKRGNNKEYWQYKI